MARWFVLVAWLAVGGAPTAAYDAVYGVAPPGLGLQGLSGLSNQQQCLLALVLTAKNQSAAISLPSIRWRATWKSKTRYLSSEALWDLAPWAAAAAEGLLPPLVDATPTANVTNHRLWLTHQDYVRRLRYDAGRARDPADAALLRALVPAERLARLATAALPEPAPGEGAGRNAGAGAPAQKKKQSWAALPRWRTKTTRATRSRDAAYGCLHARIESDMKRNPSAWFQLRRAGLDHFSTIAAHLRNQSALPGAARSVFVAVDAESVEAAELAAMREPAWPGVPFVFREERSRNLTLVEHAIVDSRVCVAAEWFVGWPGSTYANQIALQRRISGRRGTFYYNADGVRPRKDDGRDVALAWGKPRPISRKPKPTRKPKPKPREA